MIQLHISPSLMTPQSSLSYFSFSRISTSSDLNQGAFRHKNLDRSQLTQLTTIYHPILQEPSLQYHREFRRISKKYFRSISRIVTESGGNLHEDREEDSQSTFQTSVACNPLRCWGTHRGDMKYTTSSYLTSSA